MALYTLPKQYHPDFKSPKIKPLGNIEIDWDNPLTDGLVGCWVFQNGVINLVNGDRPISTTGSLEIGVDGGGKILESIDGYFTNNLKFKNGSEFSVYTDSKYNNTTEDHGLISMNGIDPLVWADTSSSLLRGQYFAGSSVFGSNGELTDVKYTPWGVSIKSDSTDSGLYVNGKLSASGDPGTFTLDPVNLVSLFTDNRPPKGKFRYLYVYDRLTSLGLANELARNPYQILKPKTPQTYFTPETSSGITVTGATVNYNYAEITATIDLTGSVDVVGQTPNYPYASISGLIDLTGAINVTGQTANYPYNAISGLIDLTAELSVTGQTPNYTYAALGGQVEFTGAISVIGATASYNYQSINGLVDLTGEISVLGQTSNYSYASINGSVELGAFITVIGNTPNYNYQNITGVVDLAGEILVNGETVGYSYSAISGFVVVGGGQAIGTVTAGFADDLYSADYKPSEITVTFKT